METGLFKGTAVLALTLAFGSETMQAAPQESGRTKRKGRQETVEEPSYIARSETEPKANRLVVIPEYLLIRQDNILLTGYGAGVGVVHHRSETLGFGALARQLFSLETLDSLYTAFDFRILWWPFGFGVKSTQTLVGRDSRDVALIETADTGGLQLEISVKEIFFNTDAGVRPLGGFGTAIMYQWPTFEDMSLGAGVGIDRLKGNDGLVLVPLRAMLQINMLL